MKEALGIVLIGRNEGARFQACVESMPKGVPVVYVDSGSTDGSQDFAREAGITVVDLQSPPKFTAARARNAGFHALIASHPDLDYVQFIDGDCTLEPGWLEAGLHAFVDEPDLAVVFGRLTERSPEASIYNKLCDDEWDGPVGDVMHCGGVALFRISAFDNAGGFDAKIIAGEEPDLCLRLRLMGFRIKRLANLMATHDAAMFHFRQWWIRSKRAGFAYTDHWIRHGSDVNDGWIRQIRSIIFWGGIIPALGILASIIALFDNAFIIGIFFVIFTIFIQIIRVSCKKNQTRNDLNFSIKFSIFMIISKPAQFYGLMNCLIHRATKSEAKIIEHKI